MTKKIFSTAVCCLALAACSKVSVEQNSDVLLTDGSAFEAGQEVTLTVSTAQTRATSEVNDSIFGFKWEGGDKIKVTVGGSSSEFVLATGAGQTSGTFVGVMPAAGATFDVQFPVDDPDLGCQVYSPSSGPFPHNKAKFAATGCTVGSSFTLTPQHSALQLKLYGDSATVDSIIVTTTSPVGKYKLDCSAAPVTVGSTSGTATPFILVVPASSGNVSFTAQTFTASREVTPITYTEYASDGTTVVYSGAGIPITVGSSVTSFTSSQTFTSGEVLNMAAKEVKVADVVIWAPVNCGYHPTEYQYGKLYQWGRKVGGGYDTSSDASMQTAVNATWPGGYNKSPDDGSFYMVYEGTFDWYTNSISKQLGSWPMKSTDTGYVAEKIANPCPTGWRVPTRDELGSLCYTDWNSSSQSGSVTRGHWDSTNNGWQFSDSLFFPAAGTRNCVSTGVSVHRGIWGYYWSSSVATQTDERHLAWCISFGSTAISKGRHPRADGESVRCVQEANASQEGGSLAPYSVTSKTSW